MLAPKCMPQAILFFAKYLNTKRKKQCPTCSDRCCSQHNHTVKQRTSLTLLLSNIRSLCACGYYTTGIHTEKPLTVNLLYSFYYYCLQTDPQ